MLIQINKSPFEVYCDDSLKRERPDELHEALGDSPVTPQQFADLMTAVLRTNQIPVPPQTLDAVTVQSAAAARYNDPKAVFVLGVNDGQFPAEIQEGGFFTEQERAENVNIGISMMKGNTVLHEAVDNVLSTMTADDFNEMMAYAISIQPLSE